MNTTNAMGDGFEEAERGLDRLEKLEALQVRAASDQAAYEAVEYVTKLRRAISALAGDQTFSELSDDFGDEVARLVEELRNADEEDIWISRIRPALLKKDV